MYNIYYVHIRVYLYIVLFIIIHRSTNRLPLATFYVFDYIKCVCVRVHVRVCAPRGITYVTQYLNMVQQKTHEIKKYKQVGKEQNFVVANWFVVVFYKSDAADVILP